MWDSFVVLYYTESEVLRTSICPSDKPPPKWYKTTHIASVSFSDDGKASVEGVRTENGGSGTEFSDAPHETTFSSA